jgi:rsbT co-antagonist protein RsbR
MSKTTAGIISKKKNDIYDIWINNQLSDFNLREDLMSNEELRQQSTELLDGFAKAIETGNMDIEAPEFEPVIEILTGLSISRAQQGFSPRETAIYVMSLKKAILEVLIKEIEGHQALLKEIMAMDLLLDSLSMVTFETFIKGREEVIFRQSQNMDEISTPVMQVWNGIQALPIIGTLDSARTQMVMENLLERIVETESSIAILDISGVPAVDSLVAQHIIKTVSATRLMGAECIISGIRPEIAQTIVHLGIDLSSVVTKASLSSALKFAFTVLDLEVVKSRKILKNG